MRLDEIPTFADDGHAFRVVVESPRGSSVKLKYDRELGVMTLSRPLPTGLVYPHDWGFVPGTSASDGDPVDALIVSDGGSASGVVVTCRALVASIRCAMSLHSLSRYGMKSRHSSFRPLRSKARTSRSWDGRGRHRPSP